MDRGYSPEVADEIAFYLAQASDFAMLEPDVRSALAEEGVALTNTTLDDRDLWLPLLCASGTMLWPLTDGFAYYRGSFASSLAALWEVPQFGSPPAVHHLCQDKFRCLALARALAVDTPATALIENGKPLSPLDVLPNEGPLFVKPATLGAKIGIDTDSRTDGLAAALDRTRRIWARYRDRALIQSYLDGDDVRVSFLDIGDGASQPAAYRVRTTARGFPTLADSLRITQLRAADSETVDLERLDHPGVLQAARRIARGFDLRDYWSMDFRLASDGRAWFLELEVCPAITIYDFLTYLREVHGCELPQAIARAVSAAWRQRQARSSR